MMFKKSKRRSFNLRDNSFAITSFVISLGLFSALCMGVIFKARLITQWDQIVYRKLFNLRSPIADQIFLFISSFNVEVFCLFLSVVSFWLLLKRERRKALYWIGIGFSTLVITAGLKHVLAIERPLSYLHFPKTGSFPSAHVVIHTTFLRVFLALFDLRIQHNSILRISNNSLYIIWVGLVCIARLYLAAHWFSDVLGGILLSIFLINVFHVFYSRQSRLSTKSRSELLFISLGTLIAGACINFVWKYHT